MSDLRILRYSYSSFTIRYSSIHGFTIHDSWLCSRVEQREGGAVSHFLIFFHVSSSHVHGSIVHVRPISTKNSRTAEIHDS